MKYFSTKEVAEIITKKTGKPISMRQVQHEIKKGFIIADRIGKRIYIISEESIENYTRRKPGHKSDLERTESNT